MTDIIITVTRAQIEVFKIGWPCSGVPTLDRIKFKFDGKGDLVDLWGINKGKEIDLTKYDGEGLSELSRQAQEQALKQQEVTKCRETSIPQGNLARCPDCGAQECPIVYGAIICGTCDAAAAQEK